MKNFSKNENENEKNFHKIFTKNRLTKRRRRAAGRPIGRAPSFKSVPYKAFFRGQMYPPYGHINFTKYSLTPGAKGAILPIERGKSMRTKRDIKLDKLFSEYLHVVQPVFDKCDDDVMFAALVAKIAKWEVSEMYGWYWEENHNVDNEENA